MYKEYNDYELVSLAQENNEDAILLLQEKYRPLVAKKIRKYYRFLQNKGLEREDLLQDGVMAVEQAIRDFRQDEEANFYTFVSLCIDRQLMKELTNTSSFKQKILNEAISLESLEDGDGSVLDWVRDSRANPEEGLFLDYEFEEMCQRIKGELTTFEDWVFELKIQGYEVREISSILDKDEKSIYNTMQRIKNKIKVME